MSVTSNTVGIVDTTTNKVVNHTDVGRAAHEGSFISDGKQFWVADRGRDTVTIVDTVRGGVIAEVHGGQIPSKVVMSPDGRRAYVNHITLPEITVIDVASRRVVDHIAGLNDVFSSDEAISPDGKELWTAHKRAGKVGLLRSGCIGDRRVPRKVQEQYFIRLTELLLDAHLLPVIGGYPLVESLFADRGKLRNK
ncbi:YncE family protein [Micromonospora sp. CA-240977]|uniref:YncE family protein n=1 Tax=Micromonospora sp. CA-240977 TaxID=3239957 RepID=UPI003D8DECDC